MAPIRRQHTARPAGSNARLVPGSLSPLRVGDIQLALSNAFDFASHVGAVAFIEINEAQHSAIAQSICQPRDEIPGQVRTTVIIKVHRQEGDVVGNVDVAEAIIKLDTIVDRERLRSEMNMLQMEVPVAIADPLLANAGVKELSITVVEVLGI